MKRKGGKKKRAKKKGKNGRKTFPELKTNEEEIILNKKEKEREREPEMTSSPHEKSQCLRCVKPTFSPLSLTLFSLIFLFCA